MPRRSDLPVVVSLAEARARKPRLGAPRLGILRLAPRLELVTGRAQRRPWPSWRLTASGVGTALGKPFGPDGFDDGPVCA